MLCEVIAYILSRQRLSAKTFVTGFVFYALQDRLSLWMLCDTSGVGGFPLHFSTGSPFGHHLRLRMVCPPLGTVGAGWEVSLFSPSPLLHFSTSPRVHPSGITRGYAWCVPAGDSGCGLGGFSFLSTSPRVRPSGITRGYAWCVPAGDSGCGSHYKKSGISDKSLYSLRG